jgi:hypothetical protein
VYAVGATALAMLTGVEPETLPHRGLRVDARGALKGRASPELVAALERMLEPDPDLRATSLTAALDGLVSSTASRPPAAPIAPPVAVAPAPLERSSEDAFVKSTRGLLWALWGLGWIIVPMVFGKVLGMAEAIPIIMFGWLALNLILGWHKGAILRAMLRQWNSEKPPSVVARRRVGVEEVSPQVRVHTSELGPEEVVAGTEVQVDEGAGARRKGR